MERLIEKIYKAVDKNDGDKVVDLMFDVKEEVEGYTGQSNPFMNHDFILVCQLY